MPLKHHLRISSLGVPELHASVFRTTHDPLAVWSQANTEHEVLLNRSAMYCDLVSRIVRGRGSNLMSLKSPYTLASHGWCSGRKARRGAQLPHLDRLIQATADEISAIW